jgi:hypothetical protein
MTSQTLNLIASGAVGAATAAAVNFAKELRFAEAALGLQHRHEERKKLHELQSRYKGRVLEAALDWDRRMSQIYEGAYRWLDPPDEERLDRREYYYHSVVFRFLQLAAIARRFEAEAFYIDAGIAQRSDFDLLRYAKAFLWASIYAELTPDDAMPGADHFRSDAFRPLLDLAYSTPTTEDGAAILPETRSRDNELIFDLARCMAMLRRGEDIDRKDEIDELLAFFDGVSPDDYDDKRQRYRRRWDRLVVLHLFVLAFIDACGYGWQRNELETRTELAVEMLLHPDTIQQELAAWLPRLGLDKQAGLERIGRHLARAAAGSAADSPEQRAERVVSRVKQVRADRGLPPLETVGPAPLLEAA